MVANNGTAVTDSKGIELATTDDFGEFDQFVGVSGLGDGGNSVKTVETGILNVTGM